MEAFMPFVATYLLVLTRISGFFVTLPLFSYKAIPPVMRIGMAIVLAWVLVFTLNVPDLEINGAYILLVVKEAVIGLSIGIIAFMVMAAIQVAGGLVDFQMGFAIANVIDPQTGTQSPLMGQFFNSMALLLLLAVNGHHVLLDGIVNSYKFLPMEQMWPAFGSSGVAEHVLLTMTAVFAISFQMAVPIVATLFLVDLALGITARAVPQLNIFVIGFPIKIGVGFIVLFIMGGVIVAMMQKIFEVMIFAMRDLMVLLGG